MCWVKGFKVHACWKLLKDPCLSVHGWVECIFILTITNITIAIW